MAIAKSELWHKDEGRTRRTRQSDRAGKACTALLETRTAKSMGVDAKNNFFCCKGLFDSLQDEWWKLPFWEWILLSRRTVRCRTTPKALKESQHSSQTKTFTTFSEANNKKTCRRSGKQLFWMNCPVNNLWDKQTVLRRNFFQWKVSKNSSWVKSKKTSNAKKTKYDISLNQLNVFFEFPEFLGEVG